MGVPITFIDKFNPDEYEILGTDLNSMVNELGIKEIGNEWLCVYRMQGGKGHLTANMHSLVYRASSGQAKSVYKRLLIRMLK